MAAPTVFVSSTFYDLRYIREGLKRFIEQMGYLPVLSEEGAVYYDPSTGAAEACMREIPNTQLFVLIIGGRFGSAMPGAEQSITNEEYQTAVKEGIPIFALVDQGTLNDFELYQRNSAMRETLERLIFPNADSVKIFDFIRQVQSRSVNNALQPFKSFADIESYLRSQWAGMMYSFLTRRAESIKVADNLALLNKISTRTEFIAEQILRNVGQAIDQLAVDFLQKMFKSQAVSDMQYVDVYPTPADIIRYPTLQACMKALYGRGFQIRKDTEHVYLIDSGGKIQRERLKRSEADYSALRDYMMHKLEESQVARDEFYDYPFSDKMTSGPSSIVENPETSDTL